MPNASLSAKYRALLESEERYRTLIEQSSDVIQLVDANGRMLYTSESVKSVLGYTPDEIMNTPAPEYIHPDDLGRFMAAFQSLLEQPGGSEIAEYRCRHKDGHWIWLETIGVNHLEDPAVRALVARFRDITIRKQYEQALSESEARLRYLAEAIPQKIFTVSSSGDVDYFYPQWTEYTGLEPKQFRGQMFAKFLHPDDAAGTVSAWQEAARSGEAFTHEHRFRRADGTYRWHLTNVRPMCDAEGGILMWIGSSTDIEDVKRAQKRQAMLEHKAKSLQQQRQQLLELHKAKDEFISLASHQLRTPATGVKQYLGMILEGIIEADQLPPEVLKVIQVAYDSNERQLKIVNDLLKVAYVDAGHLKLIKSDCDVDELIHSVMDDLAEVFATRRQKITYTNAATGITLQADCRLLRMVIENLIDNASKYSPSGKSVAVSVRRAAGFLCINVTDHGVGISREDQVRLFKKFSRIENPLSTEVGGTGLGLYWAQQVVSLHRGSIMVRSSPGKGSTFSVQLPLG